MLAFYSAFAWGNGGFIREGLNNTLTWRDMYVYIQGGKDLAVLMGLLRSTINSAARWNSRWGHMHHVKWVKSWKGGWSVFTCRRKILSPKQTRLVDIQLLCGILHFSKKLSSLCQGTSDNTWNLYSCLYGRKIYCDTLLNTMQYIYHGWFMASESAAGQN